MILVDFECPECGFVFEEITDSSVVKFLCPNCGCQDAKRIISVGDVYTANEDTAWLRTVREVVDKDPNKPHCQEFLKNPTRTNYKRWMQGEGIRPLETGEPMKPPPVDISNLQKEVFKNYRKRNRIEVRT